MSKYQTDPILQQIIDEYVPSGAFPEAEGRVIVALFAKGKPPTRAEAASCHKVPETMKVISGVDYYLTFWSSVWMKMAEDERHVTVCHELHHIATDDNGKPSIRRHEGDFCEIPEHDKESQRIAASLPKSKNLSHNPVIDEDAKEKKKESADEEEEDSEYEDDAVPGPPLTESATHEDTQEAPSDALEESQPATA